jgi:hypothetical protein
MIILYYRFRNKNDAKNFSKYDNDAVYLRVLNNDSAKNKNINRIYS